MRFKSEGVEVPTKCESSVKFYLVKGNCHRTSVEVCFALFFFLMIVSVRMQISTSQRNWRGRWRTVKNLKRNNTLHSVPFCSCGTVLEGVIFGFATAVFGTWGRSRGFKKSFRVWHNWNVKLSNLYLIKYCAIDFQNVPTDKQKGEEKRVRHIS